MKSLEAKVKESEELEELYSSLQRDWNAYKQSNPTTSRRCCTNSGITVKAIQLLHNSPTHLMSQLQGCTEEIIGDRTKLKGRRLFEDMEGETERGQVMRSLSFCYSEDEANGSRGPPHSSSSSSSSSSLPFASGEDEAKEKKGGKDSVSVATEADTRSRTINGGRYIIMLGGFAIALLIFAVCMRSTTSYGGYEGILVPT